MRIFSLLLLVGSLVGVTTVRAATLKELVAAEESTDFGVCELVPKPKIDGKEIHAILPARFPDPVVWQTYTLILAGVTGDDVVATKELTLPDGFNPRQSNLRCNKSTVTISQKGKKRRYRWDGEKLSRK